MDQIGEFQLTQILGVQYNCGIFVLFILVRYELTFLELFQFDCVGQKVKMSFRCILLWAYFSLPPDSSACSWWWFCFSIHWDWATVLWHRVDTLVVVREARDLQVFHHNIWPICIVAVYCEGKLCWIPRKYFENNLPAMVFEWKYDRIFRGNESTIPDGVDDILKWLKCV